MALQTRAWSSKLDPGAVSQPAWSSELKPGAVNAWRCKLEPGAVNSNLELYKRVWGCQLASLDTKLALNPTLGGFGEGGHIPPPRAPPPNHCLSQFS